jgi:hypothetical protein
MSDDNRMSYDEDCCGGIVCDVGDGHQERCHRFSDKRSKKFGAPAIAGATYAKPRLSIGAGILGEQIPEFHAAMRRDGIKGVDFVKPHQQMKGGPRAGTAIFESRTARKDFLKWRGLHDNDGGDWDG